MPSGKEIRNKIRSVQNTQKITRAMEMVAASKMRKAQERMRTSRPYAEKITDVAAHLAHAHHESPHPFLIRRPVIRNIGIIIVSTDKGLCGGLNTNLLRATFNRIKEWQDAGIGIALAPIGNKSIAFVQRIGGKVLAQLSGLGDIPQLEKLIGPVKIMIDAHLSGEIDQLYIAYNRFINTMKQQPHVDRLLPVPSGRLQQSGKRHNDYLYEPEAKVVVDLLLKRYIEALIYQAVAENMASEQSARMVAMKSASDNAGSVIDELKLVYNKTRQAAITKELSEIVAGAAAV